MPLLFRALGDVSRKRVGALLDLDDKKTVLYAIYTTLFENAEADGSRQPPRRSAS